MRIRQLIKSLDIIGKNPALEDFEVKGLSCNSKTVSKDFIFVAVKGARQDGNKFIAEAVRRGARAVISSSVVRRPSAGIPFIRVKDTRKALSRLATEFYGNPSKKIKVVGITGTNGKTTITYLIEAILKEAAERPAVIGTINYRFNGKEVPSKNTTPGPIELQSMLAEMLKAGVDYAIMEVSSHALDQDRALGIDFSSAIFTNLTQDHLDYHKTIKKYFQAKAKLFINLSPDSSALINNDDKFSAALKKLTRARVITYGIENTADVMADKIKSCIDHTELLLRTPKQKVNLKFALIGRHNVYNVLVAAAWALNEGIDINTIKSAIEKFSLVPGRLEKITFSGDFSIFVDYAHTEDALKNVLNTLRPLTRNRIITVFGCGGERDKTKRPKMGRVVTEMADYAIITSDNPRSEDPLEIIRQIRKGIRKKNYFVVPERYAAIRKGLSLARAGDIVLVAGKGHETCQILKDRTVHFDDREVLRECLKSKNY